MKNLTLLVIGALVIWVAVWVSGLPNARRKAQPEVTSYARQNVLANRDKATPRAVLTAQGVKTDNGIVAPLGDAPTAVN